MESLNRKSATSNIVCPTKTTECQNPECPHTLDSKQRGLITFPSICLEITGDYGQEEVWVCLPCGYKCGAVD